MGAASGLLFLASLVGAALMFGHYTGGVHQFAANLALIDLHHWASLTALTAAFYLADYARLYLLLSLFGIRLPLGRGLALCAASNFAASLTPAAELHAPIMVLLMTQLRIPASTAAAVTLAKSLFMTAWIMGVAFIAPHVGGEPLLPPEISSHLGLWQLPLLVVLALLLALIVFPGRVERLLNRGITARSPRWLVKLVGGVTATTRQLSVIGTSTAPAHIGCHLMSLADIALYIAIGAYLAAALGVPVSAGKAFTAFSHGLLVAYVAPVPGSVGVTELATSYLLDPALTPSGMAVAILQRTLCWYLSATIGAFVVADAVRRAGVRAVLRMMRER